MITTVSKLDYVIGYLEWNVVDSEGDFDVNGAYIYVANLWVHPRFRQIGYIRELVRKVYDDKRGKHCPKVYWIREEKYPERPPKTWDKEYLVKKILGGNYGRQIIRTT